MEIQDYIKQNKGRFLNELFNLLRIPSVSADSAYLKDTCKAADFVADSLKEAGCDNVKCYDTPFNIPIVYGEKIIDSKLPTVMVYGHYDVQPADPLELWDSKPFEPIIKNTENHPQGAIYARGACDDKGQMYLHIKAFEYLMLEGKLPCNVKFLIEGEEEVGSEGLAWFIEKEKGLLSNDIIIISDTAMISNDCPSITTGLKGLSYMEVQITGPNRDLHSGVYGGAVANPINILTKMIASLQDEQQRITIPRFYEDIVTVSEKDRAKMGEIPFSLDAYKDDLDIDDVWGETGYTTNERNSIRPTLDVNGIWGGYTGEGSKTVLPSKAYAKISMRLVPNQNWEIISKLFEKHFKSIAPKSVKVKVKTHHGGLPYVLETDHIAYQAAEKAYETSFGKKPYSQRAGGSIPIVSLFESVLGSKSVLMGFGLDTDALHSPNEHFGVFNFLKGIETASYFYKYFTTLYKQ